MVVGLTFADCFPDDLTAQRSRCREVVAEYPYVSMTGTHVATKVRYRDVFHPKLFAWRVGDRWRLNDAEKAALPIYRERDLIECDTIYVTEGEKAVDRLWELKLPATCTPKGSWEPRWTESLCLLGVQHVIILSDNDAVGRKQAEIVAAALHADQVDVRVVALPGLGLSQDVYDWFAVGHTREELETIARSTPKWKPGLTEALRLQRRRALTYARVIKYREKQRRLATGAADIRSVTLASTDIGSVTSVPVTLKRCNADERSSDQPSKEDELDPVTNRKNLQ